MHLVLILTVGTNKINKGSILCFQVNSENSVFIRPLIIVYYQFFIIIQCILCLYVDLLLNKSDYFIFNKKVLKSCCAV